VERCSSRRSQKYLSFTSEGASKRGLMGNKTPVYHYNPSRIASEIFCRVARYPLERGSTKALLSTNALLSKRARYGAFLDANSDKDGNNSGLV